MIKNGTFGTLWQSLIKSHFFLGKTCYTNEIKKCTTYFQPNIWEKLRAPPRTSLSRYAKLNLSMSLPSPAAPPLHCLDCLHCLHCFHCLYNLHFLHFLHCLNYFFGFVEKRGVDCSGLDWNGLDTSSLVTCGANILRIEF